MENEIKTPQSQTEPPVTETLTQEPPVLLDRKTGWKAAFSEHKFLLLCMLIPAALMYLVYLSREIYPFGNGTVLVLDLNGQYVWFFEALRNAVYGDAELLYSFSRALGGEFVGIYAYYLASPLSYIVCLFPQDMMQEALLTLFLLKVALCGGTFGFYVHKTVKNCNSFAAIAFSTLYALTSYAVVQQHNTMWIDAVIFLPLITLGMESLIKYGKFKLYTVTLAVTLFSNFYIGYMVCIYCLIYFFLYYLAHNEDNRNNPMMEEKHFSRSLFRVAFYSMLAVGVSAVILLGAYYALNFGKTTFTDPSWSMTLKFDLIDLAYKLLPGSYDTVRPAGLPFVYCGVLTLLLTPAYFFSKKYSMRQKIVSIIFVFVFVASFSFSVTDLIWHGFQKPNWLNYRYSFMLCFYLCVLACRAFADFEGVCLKSVAATGGFIALVCMILQNYTSGEYIDPDDFTCIWFTLVMVVVYLAALGLLRKTTNKQMISIVLLAAISVEVYLNGLWNLNELDADVAFTKHSYYTDYLSKIRPIVKQVQDSDDSFYRMEKTTFRKTNDNMALNIRGLSGSTSTLNKETIQFLNKMGYSSKSHWSKYLGGNPVSDSLLGLKYLIAESAGNLDDYYEIYATDPENSYLAYYNPYALSLAYGVDEDILDFPLGFVETMDNKKDDDEEESKFSELISAFKKKVNEWLDIEETINSAEYEDEYDSPFERLNAMVTAMLGENNTVKLFVPIKHTVTTRNLDESYVSLHKRYEAIDKDEKGVLIYSLDMPVDAELFFYMPTDYAREVKLTLEANGNSTSKGTFNGNETARIISLGKQSKKADLSLYMTLTTQYLYSKTNSDCFYYIDWAVFEDCMARLAQDQYQITDYTESSFDGTFKASKSHELVMTTLAFDKGWKVYVDGNEVETIKALGSLVSFYVDGEAGQTHDIEIKYAPRAISVGLVISAVSAVIMLAMIIFEKRMRKIPYLSMLTEIPAPVLPDPEVTAAELAEEEKKQEATEDWENK